MLVAIVRLANLAALGEERAPTRVSEKAQFVAFLVPKSAIHRSCQSRSVQLLSAQVTARNGELPGVVTLGFCQAGLAVPLHPINPDKLTGVPVDSVENGSRPHA